MRVDRFSDISIAFQLLPVCTTTVLAGVLEKSLWRSLGGRYPLTLQSERKSGEINLN